MKTQTNTLRETALWLHDHGANVAPLKGKAVFVDWQNWQSERQPETVVKGFPWGQATGLGILHGIGGWRCLDYDESLFAPVQKTLDELGFPHTYPWVIESGSGEGWHIWIRCLDNEAFGNKEVYTPKTSGAFDHLEVRWNRHQTALPPSVHPDTGAVYEFANGTPDGAPWEVEAEKIRAAVEAIGRRERSKTTAGTSSTTDWSSGDGASTSKIRRALDALPDGHGQEYWEWLEIIMCVKDGTGGDDDTAEKILKEWREEWEAGEYARKLASLDDGAPDDVQPKTVATLFDLAKEHGFQPTAPQPPHPVNRTDPTPTDGAPQGDGQAGDVPEPPTPSSPAKSETQAETLLRLADPAELWKTPRGDFFATFPVRDHERTAPLRQKGFRQWLRHRFYEERGKPPGSQALQDAIDTLAAQAQFEGEVKEAHLRIAGNADSEKRVYVDLGSEQWDCVEVTPEGWGRTTSPRASFRRVQSMKPLPDPAREDMGDPEAALERLRDHVPVKDDANFALLLAWLVQALKPSGPYPILVITGEQGSGKTTTAKMIRALVDPNHVPTRTAPRSEEDLLVAAENSWVLNFDNLSKMPNWLSDAFCRLATGGGFGTRKLYTNREEEVFYHQRPIILNGIEDLTERPDLADRALVIELDTIPEEDRESERKVWDAFEQDRQHIIAGLLSAVSVALGGIEYVDLQTLPRMADFAKWAEAAEPALPVDPGTFREAYATNRETANRTALESDEVARAIQALVEDAGEWHGKMSELCEDLKQYVFNPDNPPAELGHFNSLSSHMKRIMPVLREVGIRREDDAAKRSRAFTLYKEEPEEDTEDDAPF